MRQCPMSRGEEMRTCSRYKPQPPPKRSFQRSERISASPRVPQVAASREAPLLLRLRSDGSGPAPLQVCNRAPVMPLSPARVAWLIARADIALKDWQVRLIKKLKE